MLRIKPGIKPKTPWGTRALLQWVWTSLICGSYLCSFDGPMEGRDSQNTFAEKVIKFGKLSVFRPASGKDEE